MHVLRSHLDTYLRLSYLENLTVRQQGDPSLFFTGRLDSIFVTEETV